MPQIFIFAWYKQRQIFYKFFTILSYIKHVFIASQNHRAFWKLNVGFSGRGLEMEVAPHYWWRSSERRTITFETVVKLEAGCCWRKYLVAIFLAQLICMGAYVTFYDFSITFVLVWVGTKNIVIFMKFSFQSDGGVKLGVITFLESYDGQKFNG